MINCPNRCYLRDCDRSIHQYGVMKEHIFDQQKGKFVDLHIFGMTVQKFRQNRRIAKLSRRLIGRDITVETSPKVNLAKIWNNS